MKKICITLSLLITLLSLISCGKKGDDLRKLTLQSENGVITFTASTFKEYVMTHPRPYDVVILFTLKRKCNRCERVKNEYVQVSESFRDANGFKPDMVTHKRAVFFGVLYYSEETSSIFKSLKFPSLTNILYTTPKNIQLDDKGEMYIQYDEEYVQNLEFNYFLSFFIFTISSKEGVCNFAKSTVYYLVR